MSDFYSSNKSSSSASRKVLTWSEIKEISISGFSKSTDVNVSDFCSQESTTPLHEQKFPEQPLIPVNTTNGAAGTVQDTGRRRTVPLHTDLRHQQGHKTVKHHRKHHQKQRRRHLQQPLLLVPTFPSLGVPSSNEETVHRYARAYRTGNLQEIKTAKVSSVNVNPTPTSSTTRAFQNITGIKSYCSFIITGVWSKWQSLKVSFAALWLFE